MIWDDVRIAILSSCLFKVMRQMMSPDGYGPRRSEIWKLCSDKRPRHGGWHSSKRGRSAAKRAARWLSFDGKKGSDIPHLSPARLCCSNCICKYLQFAPGLQHPLDSTHWYSYFMAFLLWSVNCVSKLLCLNCLCHIQVPYNKTKAVEPRFEESAALILTFVLAHLLQLSTTAVNCQVFLCTCYPNVQQNSGRWRSWLCHASSSEFGYSLVIQDNRPPNDTHQIARFGSLNRGPPKNSWETFEPSAISKQSYG